MLGLAVVPGALLGAGMLFLPKPRASLSGMGISIWLTPYW